LDGISLDPYLSDPRYRLGRATFVETAAGDGRYLAVKAGRWKYAEYVSGDRELYDLAADPYELQSLHADRRKAGVIAELAHLLERFRTCAGAECVVTGYANAWPEG
jgi:hypothetical protein